MANPRQLQAMMEMLQGGEGRSIADCVKKQKPELLRICLEEYLEDNDIQVGQFVTWKPHMKNMRLPDTDDVAIVVEVIKDAPVLNTMGGDGTASHGDRRDIVVGVVDEDGDFMLFVLNSKRLRVVTEV